MPKKEIGADRFIESNPIFDGRGVLIAIFDSGVDPAAAGLQVTSDGKPKILDVLDCSGSGDVDTSKVVKADEDGVIMGASGVSLVVNSSWKNPTGDWHVGYKLVYELFTDTLTSRLKVILKGDLLRYHVVLIGLRRRCELQALTLLGDFFLTLFSHANFGCSGFLRTQMEFHGININKEIVDLDGSDAPVRIEATSLLSCEKLVPATTLNKIRIPYRPVEVKLCTLPTDRDKLVSGKQILALTLTYKFKLDDGAEIKPVVPLLNGRVYDTKFESQFYVISDSNKRVYATGDVYPNSVKLPKGDYNLQLCIRSLEAFYVAPPTKDKLPKNCPAGSVLLGAISYKKPSPKGKQIVSYQVSFIVPPTKIDEKPKDSSSSMCTKIVHERLAEEDFLTDQNMHEADDHISN